MGEIELSPIFKLKTIMQEQISTSEYDPEVDKIRKLLKLCRQLILEFYIKPDNNVDIDEYRFKNIDKVLNNKDYYRIEVSKNIFTIYVLEIDLDPIDLVSFNKKLLISSIIENTMLTTFKACKNFISYARKTKKLTT